MIFDIPLKVKPILQEVSTIDFMMIGKRGHSFFFFSSRRRHTRWNCDWSSDVCSSDLLLAGEVKVSRVCARIESAFNEPAASPDNAVLYCRRSEDRRVGKECRSRWS